MLRKNSRPEDDSRWDSAMPTIDTSWTSLKDLRASPRIQHPLRTFVWLRYLRPLVLSAFWAFVLYFVWEYFFNLGIDRVRSPLETLTRYALVSGVILLIMLAVAFLRQRQALRVRRTAGRGASPDGLAQYADVPRQQLGEWQNAQQMMVHHDDQGQVRSVNELTAASKGPSA